METEPKIKGDKSSELIERFVADGNEVVHFKLLRNAQDVENKSLEFHPEMCHQVFDEGETIFGYENLSINLYFTAGSLNTFMGIDYKRKISKELSDGLEPDDIVGKIGKVLQGGYVSNMDEFLSSVEKDQKNFKPVGELVHSFDHKIKKPVSSSSPSDVKQNGNSKSNGHSENDGVNKSFEIYAVDPNTSPKFVEYLKKMESFIMFFIDAASFLEISPDDKWHFFTLYEKYKTSDGNTCYAFAGYSSVYQFYSYPDLMRPRVAQMLILPPFQKQGLGVSLMSCIYTFYRSNPKVKEITVEDPSDDFELLRDYVDARDCKGLKTYAPEFLRKGFSPTMAEEAQLKLKMTKRQAHRVYEILRLQITNVNNDDEYREFRLDVKRRLNIPYQKQDSDIKRMNRRKHAATELQKAKALDDSTRKTELESGFQLLLAHYRDILKRLEKHSS